MKKHLFQPPEGCKTITAFLPPDKPITLPLRHEDSGHIPCTGKFCDICSLFAQLSAKLKDFEDMIWAAMAKLWQPYYRQQIAAMMENEDA